MPAVVAVTFFVATTGAQAGQTPPPGTYTYQDALRLGILDPDDFAPPPGMEICPPYDAAIASVTAPPSQAAPVCFINPADLATSLVAVSQPESSSTEFSTSAVCDLTAFPTHRFNGACDTSFQYRGGSMLTEVSDPSVCHTSCPALQHLYTRVALTTPADNYIEVGWGESSHAPSTGDVQRVTTVTAQGLQQTIMNHGIVLPGNQYAYRADHCGLPGELRVCMEMWNGSSWTLLRTWSGVMRCLNSNGTFNCSADIFTELATDDSATWFDLNGGADGLRTQNIEVKRDWWELFTTGVWLEQSPYTICRVADFYHFTVFRGPPSC